MKILEDNILCSTGIEEIDAQHRHLLDLAERLERVIEQSNDQATMAAELEEMDTVRSIIAELVEYASYHFDTEERYMRDNDYPEYDQHHQEHIRKAESIRHWSCFWQKSKDCFSVEVAEFINDFWDTHVLEYDRKLGEFLKGQGVG